MRHKPPIYSDSDVLLAGFYTSMKTLIQKMSSKVTELRVLGICMHSMHSLWRLCAKESSKERRKKTKFGMNSSPFHQFTLCFYATHSILCVCVCVCVCEVLWVKCMSLGRKELLHQITSVLQLHKKKQKK